MPLYVKNAGSWPQALAAYVKSGGTWYPARFLYIKSGGVWKQVMPDPTLGASSWASPGSFSYVVPAGVWNVTYSVVGAGAGGGSGSMHLVYNYNYQMWESGGGGSSGVYATGTLAVTPGETLTPEIGTGGGGGPTTNWDLIGGWGVAGVQSRLLRGGTPLVTCAGGNPGYPGATDLDGGVDNYGFGGASAGSGSEAGHYGGYNGSGPSGWGPCRNSQTTGAGCYTNPTDAGRGGNSPFAAGGAINGGAGSLGSGGAGGYGQYAGGGAQAGGAGGHGYIVITPVVA
jgi:hypothetical protein